MFTWPFLLALIQQLSLNWEKYMTIDTLLIAIALAFILEGFFPAFFPNKWRAYVAKLSEESTTNIRNIGLVVMGFGAFLLYIFS